MLKRILKKIYKLIVKVAKKITNFDSVFEERERLLQENSELKISGEKPFGWPNGHYYSPVHSLEDLDNYEEVVKRSTGKFAESLPGFSEEKMLKNYKKISKFFTDFDYPVKENNKSRFYIENCSYPITDALVLFSMIRYIKPKRIIEIGSGFTSGLMMDVNERFFDNKIDITFIEPYPDLLLSRMGKEDKKRYKIIPKKVQEVPLKIFKELKSGDILFIDSTHVSKFNSDVNYELFDILPIINPGVTIHFHDVFDGFEYPLQWLKDGWAWNEDYMLRSFLNGNTNYEILILGDYLTKRYKKLLIDSLPRYKKVNSGSLWITKIK